MTPTYAISSPMHPWAKVAVPVAIAAVGGATAYGLFRATDGDRSATDRVISGALGVGVAVGATMLGAKFAGIGYGIEDAVRAGTTAWPKGTATVTRGAGTWYITPQRAIGDALEIGGLSGGLLGGFGGLLGGLYASGGSAPDGRP